VRVVLPRDAEVGGIIESLRWFPQLRELGISKTDATDEMLRHLATLRNLESLYMSQNRITDDGIRQIAPLKRLKLLDVRSTNISDDAMDTIGQLANLERLDLAGTYVTDSGLTKLVNLNNLVSLTFPNAATDAGLQHVSGLYKLEALYLSWTQVQGPGLIHLKKLPSLKTLVLHDTLITDDALDLVGDLGSLQGEMSLTFVAVTSDAVDRLHKRLPKAAFGVSGYVEHIERAKQRLLESGAELVQDNDSPRRAVTLRLTDAEMTKENLNDLRMLRHLQTLDLSGCELPLADMSRLVSSLTRLQKVSMANTNVTDSALHFLTMTTQLRELNLSNTGITDASVPLLTRLYRLEILNVAGTQITPEAIAELQQALPDCKVVK
jgi:internalin A